MKNPTTPYRLLWLTNFLGGLVFYAPVALLVRTAQGITTSEFFLLQTILSLGILLFELPAGLVTDKIGYKASLLLSAGFLTAARSVLLFASNFLLFGVEAILESLAFSFLSGTSSAYLYHFYKGEDYAVVSGRLANAGTLGFILSTVSYSFLFSALGLSGLVALTCIATALSFAVTWLLPAEKVKKAEKEKHPARKIHLPRRALSCCLFLGVLSVSSLVTSFFYAPKVEKTGLSYEILSILILGYSAVELLAPLILKHIPKRAYSAAVPVLCSLSALGFFALFMTDSHLVYPIMLLIPLVASVLYHILDVLVNEALDAAGLHAHRAAALSLMNMGNNVLEIVFLFLSALFTGNEAGRAFLFVAFGFFILVPISLIVHLRKHKT